ncbi:MAG: ABC-2 transporter permease [Muricoprocola sp.]
MRGLLQKDICLLLQRSRALLIMLGIGVLMGFSTDGSGTFVIGYMTMLCSLLATSTISYDEFDNGYPFLLTLPITKKTYVYSKFVFCLLADLAGWVISILIYVGCMIAKGNPLTVDVLPEVLAFIPVFVVLTAIMLPLQLKFGAEKSSMVIALTGGGIFVLAYFGSKLMPGGLKIPQFLLKMNDLTVVFLLVLLSLTALLISYLCSLHIMEHKQY